MYCRRSIPDSLIAICLVLLSVRDAKCVIDIRMSLSEVEQRREPRQWKVCAWTAT